MLKIYDAISQMQRALHLLGSEIQRQLHVILSRFEVFRQPTWYKPTGYDEKDVRNFGNAVWNCHSTNFGDSYIYDRIYRCYSGEKSEKICHITSYLQKLYLNSSKLVDICSHSFPSSHISLYPMHYFTSVSFFDTESIDELIKRNGIPRNIWIVELEVVYC